MNYSIEILKTHHHIDALQAKSYKLRGEDVPEEILERLRDLEETIIYLDEKEV